MEQKSFKEKRKERLLMKPKLFLLLLVGLQVDCGSTKVIRTETIIQQMQIVDNSPSTIQLWLRVKDGIIADNAVLTGGCGDLTLCYVDRGNDYSILRIWSPTYNKYYVFNIPHRNGELTVTGYKQ